jgi:hypothetical protein
MAACSASPTAKAHGTEATTQGFVVLPKRRKTMNPIRARRARKQQTERQNRGQPYIPHSSWALSGGPARPHATRALQPGEFWEKLGL